MAELGVLHALIRISGLARLTDTLLIHVFILFSAMGARHLGPIHLAMNEVSGISYRRNFETSAVELNEILQLALVMEKGRRRWSF